jgi:hypothetical protein
LKNEKGFLVLEMLIAGVILTASIAAAMYLFRIGAQNLERVNNSNLLSAKLPQALSLLRALDLNKATGTEELGDGVLLRWQSKLMEKRVPGQAGGTTTVPIVRAAHELYLFQVDFSLEYEDRLSREYSIDVFRSKPIQSPSEPAALF